MLASVVVVVWLLAGTITQHFSLREIRAADRRSRQLVELLLLW